MSRSFKKNPFCGMSLSESEKKDKTIANRKLRRISRAIRDPDEKVYPRLREVSDTWKHTKDGRQRFTDKKLLRK